MNTNRQPALGFSLIEILVVIALVVLAGFVVFSVLRKQVPNSPQESTGVKLLGTGLTPANTPHSSSKDIQDSVTLAAEIGGHLRIIKEWKDNPKTVELGNLIRTANNKALKVHLYLSPISQDNNRSRPAIPANIGANSFGDSTVRQAFVKQALEFAALKPDLLGIGTEVNLLGVNQVEFNHYVSLTKETYAAIKQNYPQQTVTLSFQWDEMVRRQDFTSLDRFASSTDVYAFTSYPEYLGTPSQVPANYYAGIRAVLPTQRIGISEIGWSSASPSSEQQQADFYSRLPQLVSDLKPEFVTLALLHDVKAFGGNLSNLNSTGVRNYDGTPKTSWNTIVNLGL